MPSASRSRSSGCTMKCRSTVRTAYASEPMNAESMFAFTSKPVKTITLPRPSTGWTLTSEIALHGIRTRLTNFTPSMPWGVTVSPTGPRRVHRNHRTSTGRTADGREAEATGEGGVTARAEPHRDHREPHHEQPGGQRHVKRDYLARRHERQPLARVLHAHPPAGNDPREPVDGIPEEQQPRTHQGEHERRARLAGCHRERDREAQHSASAEHRQRHGRRLLPRPAPRVHREDKRPHSHRRSPQTTSRPRSRRAR